jgi:hypothetical protein
LCWGFSRYGLVNYLPGLPLNRDPSDLFLLNSWDYRHEPPYLTFFCSFLRHYVAQASLKLACSSSASPSQVLWLQACTTTPNLFHFYNRVHFHWLLFPTCKQCAMHLRVRFKEQDSKSMVSPLLAVVSCQWLWIALPEIRLLAFKDSSFGAENPLQVFLAVPQCSTERTFTQDHSQPLKCFCEESATLFCNLPVPGSQLTLTLPQLLLFLSHLLFEAP